MTTRKFNFTKGELLATEGNGKQQTLRDTQQRGLVLLISPAGTKTFYVNRKVNGRAERVLIGRFPDFTVQQARKRAAFLNQQIDSGENPNDLKRQKRDEMTLGELHEIYMERYAYPHLKYPQNPEGIYRIRVSQWHNRKLSGVTKADIAKLLNRINTQRSGGTANKTLSYLKSIFNRAIEWDLWKYRNPTEGIKKFPTKSRERYLLPEELPRFLKANEQTAEPWRSYFLLLLFTGARSGNVKAMEWNQINFEDEEWMIPETKNGEPATIPLIPQAMEILHALRKAREPNETLPYVFIGSGKSVYVQEPKKAWHKLLERAGIEDLRMHDLRHTFGTYLSKTGANQFVIRDALSHKSLQSSAIYVNKANEPIREAATHAFNTILSRTDETQPEEIEQ